VALASHPVGTSLFLISIGKIQLEIKENGAGGRIQYDDTEYRKMFHIICF
jgi:hypothetical protein